MRLARSLYLVPGLSMGNACLVTEPEVALFDCGLPGDGPAVLAYLRELSIAPADLRVIALTHADPGHAGAAPWLRRNSGARILASAAASAVAAGAPAGTVRAAWRLALGLARRRTEAFVTDGVLAEGDVVAGFQVVATPGHAAGHIAFFRPDDGILLAGDAVRVAGRDLLAPAFWDSESEVRSRISLARLADLPVHLLVAGHGPPYAEPGAELRRAGGPPGFMEDVVRRREERLAKRRRS